MRARLVLLTTVLGLLTLFTAQAIASEIAPGELGLLLGITRLDRDVVGPGFKPDYSPVGGIRFGTNMNRKVSYFLEGLYGKFDTNVGNEKSSILETRAGAERNWKLGNAGSNWYLAGALGYADANLPGGGMGDFGRPLVSAGIGLRGPQSSWGRAHVELREEWWLGDNGIGGNDVANTQLLVGVSWGLRGESRQRLFEKGKMSLTLEGVNFMNDSAELTPGSKRVLNRVASSLKEWSEVDVEVEGHTDSVADDAYNMDLSQRRAESVRAYLIERGVSASRLSAKGYGETRPVASNETPEGRAKNRRVELRRKN
jgi:outer membrane protein OmpA-like peptidoglycan-associated protein